MNSERNPQASNRLRAPDRRFTATLSGLARSDGEESWLRNKRRGLAPKYSVIGVLLILFVATAVTVPTPSFGADIGISIRISPPPLPVYEQPLCPEAGYIWTPGFWAYDPVDGYYWVPGTWVMAPEPGFLWTPGYWGWSGGLFMWHAGYWGTHVGFYGGVDYGFGYTGVGYEGGYWRGRDFFYNRTVNNVNGTNITNVYSRTVVNKVRVTHVSYNGGPGGLNARPTSAEMQAEHDRHIAATSVQQQHQNSARQDRAQFASVNHGKPAVMASARPSEFRASGAARPVGKQAMTTHGTAHMPANNARMEHSNSGAGATHPSRAATPPASRSSARPQGRTSNLEPRQAQHQTSHAAPSPTPERSPRPQARHEVRANPPAQARPQVRESEPRPTQRQPSHAVEAPKHESAPRPQVKEERKANPPAERKPQGREAERHP
jgi:hypothetical protein